MTPLKVTAVLAGPMACEPPRLDALLEKVMVVHLPSMGRAQMPHSRGDPAPPQGYIPIPIKRTWLGDRQWLVPHCSDPIYLETTEHADHFTRSIDTGNADVLAPDKRRVFVTGNSWTKSYRLPLRVRPVDRVVWYCVGSRKDVRRRLRKSVAAIGKKISMGYGTVREWIIDDVDEDMSWYAPSGQGPVLMRTMPSGPWLPDNLIGARPEYGAPVSPYWHPDRMTDVVVPC